MITEVQLARLYSAAKLKYPHTLFLLQYHREYIAFDQDAEIISAIAGIKMDANPPEFRSISVSCQNLKVVIAKLLNHGHMVAVGRKPKKKDSVLDPLNFVKICIKLYILEASDNYSLLK